MNYNFSFLKLYFSLEVEDRKFFALFIKRNYPNKKPFAKILKYLKSLDNNGEGYDTEQLAKAVLNDKSKNKELGTLLSALDEKCREWLILNDYQKESIESKILVLDIINREGLSDEVYYKRSKRLQKLIEESPFKDMDSEYNKWQTVHNSFSHSSFNHIQQREKESLMAQAEKSLDNFYILVKLQYAYERIVAKRLIKADAIKEFLPEPNMFHLEYLDATHPLVRFYALAIQLELTEDIEYYYTAKSLLLKNDHLISPVQLTNYFICLYNYAINSYKKKNIPVQQLFKLQKIAAERNWITGGNGQIAAVIFNNIVNIGCILKETDWVKNFIKKYSKKLPASKKKTTLALANARIYFSEKKYKEAIFLLSPLAYNIDYGTLRIKSLLMCCHFEAEKTNVHFLKTTFKNFQIQIENMKILSDELKEEYLMFSKILQKFTNKNTDYEKLLIDMKQYKKLAYREWLLEKIEEKIIK